MYIGDFINYVKRMRAAQVARKAGSKPDAILAWELEKEVDRGLAEGITVVEAIDEKKLLLPASTVPTIMNSENKT
jgi:hypothetical protein